MYGHYTSYTTLETSIHIIDVNSGGRLGIFVYLKVDNPFNYTISHGMPHLPTRIHILLNWISLMLSI